MMYETQKDRVRDYMIRHGKITTAECFFKLGITRLSAAIYLLKKDGVNVKKKGITKKMPDGTTQYYEEFWIEA